MDLCGLIRIEVVSVSLAPLAVALGKDCAADRRDTFRVPEGYDEIYPLLTAVLAGGTVKPAVDSGERLIQQCDEDVGQRDSGLGIQVKLPVQGL